MTLTNKLKITAPKFLIHNIQIENVNQIKLLGLIINKKLNVNAHIRDKQRQCNLLLNGLSRTCRRDWRITPRALQIMYNVIFIPLFFYAVEVWVAALDRQYNIKRIKETQRRILIRILRCHKTTPRSEVLLFANVPPLELVAREKAAIYNQLKNETILIGNKQYKLDIKSPLRPNPGSEQALPFKTAPRFPPNIL